MPIYEYQCKACQHQFEVLQKISDPLLIQCPKCQQNSLQKLISAVGFQLKGGGWYETDFKNPAKPQTEVENKSEKKETTTESVKPEKKSASTE